MCHAVWKVTGTAAASTNETLSAMGRTLRAGTMVYSACPAAGVLAHEVIVAAEVVVARQALRARAARQARNNGDSCVL